MKDDPVALLQVVYGLGWGRVGVCFVFNFYSDADQSDAGDMTNPILFHCGNCCDCPGQKKNIENRGWGKDMATKPDFQQLEIYLYLLHLSITYLCTMHTRIYFLTEILLECCSSSGRQTGHVLIYIKSPHI